MLLILLYKNKVFGGDITADSADHINKYYLLIGGVLEDATVEWQERLQDVRVVRLKESLFFLLDNVYLADSK